MMVALNSQLDRVLPGESEPPYYCPSCTREVQPGRIGDIKVFLHPDPSCQSEPPTVESVRLRTEMSSKIGEECVDVVIGNRIAAGKFPDIGVILEPVAVPRTSPDVAEEIRVWNELEVAPLFIWCAPHYGNFRMKAGELHLLASVPEAMIIEHLNRADYPYIVWQNGQLFGMRIYSAKERFYFGTIESIELNKAKPVVYETVYGQIAGLDAVEATQSKL